MKIEYSTKQNGLVLGHVCFRLLERDDLKQRALWINDPDVQETLSFDWPTSLSKTQRWFEKVVFDSSRIDFSIFESGGSYIGFCGLVDINRAVGKAEHYLTIGDKRYWGKGIGADAYRLLAKYAFLELGLNRLYGYQSVHNARAHRLVKKLGWVREGCLRQDRVAHGEIVDRYVVAILRNEWLAAEQGNAS